MSAIGSLHFIRPAWLLALPLALLVPVAWRYLRRPSGDWARVCDSHLLRWLSVGEQVRRAGRFGAWVAVLVLAVAALALSGPSWERLPDQAFASRTARVVVLDLSASMLAQDLKPDRLTQVRYRLSDILAANVEGQVGLVAYAGDAYVVTPLTSDTNTIANMLPALRPDIMPSAGSRADRGLDLAAELLHRSGAGTGEVLLVTDSANASDAGAAARLARDGIVTSVLAVGTRDGAPIPSGNGFLSDAQGNVVIARTDLQALREVAQAGGGRLSRLDLQAANDQPWADKGAERFKRKDDSLGERWKDTGPWLVLLLLPLVAAGFRRGLLFSLVLVIAPAAIWAPQARAGVWEDLWQRRDQQAQAALQAQKPAVAAGLARDPDISGEAWYRSGDYPQAAAQWQQVTGADAHYNRGNALAVAGDLQGAIKAYDQALSVDPDMADAKYNKALVEKLKQQQDQQQAKDQSGKGEQQQDGSADQQQQDQSGDQSQESQQQQGEGQQQEQDAQQGQKDKQGQDDDKSQAWTEEDAQAMEQWLRRIPDDPGGLLRRKFRNEYQRRGAPPSDKDNW